MESAVHLLSGAIQCVLLYMGSATCVHLVTLVNSV